MERNVTLIQHPLVGSLLARLRSTETRSGAFRRHLHEISRLMAFELTRDLETRPIEIVTPMGKTEGVELIRPLVLVPILRAGLGMLNGIIDITPDAQVGHIGMARDEETHLPDSYYCKMPPDLDGADVLLIDPMLATGSSSAAAATQLKAQGARHLRFLCLVACPEGIAHFEEQHPDVPIYTAAIDEKLDENAYIVPGLGDAGDRYFGTL